METVVNILYYVIPFVVLLGILVFVHEFGHFIIARMLGVKVVAFSIGFGKNLWSRTDKKGTCWKISAIPLGGYCQFLGDADASSTTSKSLTKLSKEEKAMAFPLQKTWKKLAIVVAGPLFNYLLAILIFIGIFFAFGKMVHPSIVGGVIEGGAASEAGIIVGDEILSVNGVPTPDFQTLSNEIMLSESDEAEIEIKRSSPSSSQASNMQDVDYNILRLKVILKDTDYDDKVSGKTKRRMLGVSSTPELAFSEKLSFSEAVVAGFEESYNITAMTLRGVWQMITGRRGGKEVGGIIRIAEMSGDVSKTGGIIGFIYFMALLSVNLGLINLFPIPVLDGGNIVIFLIEMVVGHELKENVKDYIFKFGLLVILAIMLLATWNDILHLANRWFY